MQSENTLAFHASTLDELNAKILAFQERNLEFIATRVDYSRRELMCNAVVAFKPYISVIKNLTDDALRTELRHRCAQLLRMSDAHIHQWAAVNDDPWCYTCGVRKIPLAALRRDDAAMCLCGHYDYRHVNGEYPCMGLDTSTNESYCPCTQYEAWTTRQAPRTAYVALTSQNTAYVALTSQNTPYTRMSGKPVGAGLETVQGSTAHEVLRKTAKACGWRSEMHVNSTGRIITDVYL